MSESVATPIVENTKIAATRGAINGLMAEVMEDHIRMHVIDPERRPNSERAQATEELIDVVRSYLK